MNGGPTNARSNASSIAIDVKGLTGMKALVQLAITRGEIKHRELGDFPQLVVAPAIVAVIWQSLFARHAPLDGLAMFKVHLDLIFGERSKT